MSLYHLSQQAGCSMRCVILCRVSSREQAEGFSLDAQERLLREYCEKQGFEIAQVYSFPESASGKFARVKYREMLGYVESQKIPAIVVEKTDRLLRNLTDYAEIKRLVFDRGIEIHFVKEREILSKSSNSHVRQVFGFKALLAEGYIDNLSEEVFKGLKEKAESGYFPHRAPFGYRTKGKTMEPIPDEVQLIQQITQQYIGGQSIGQIKDGLNAQGIRTRSGKRWSKHSVHRILSSSLYTGSFEWRGKVYQGSYAPIITKEAHAQILDIMTRAPTTKRSWPLSGLLVNGHGRRMTGELQKGRVYYGGTLPTGGKGYIREDRALELIGEEIMAAQFPDWLAQEGAAIAREIIAENDTTQGSDLRRAQKDISDVEAMLNRLLDLHLSGGLDKESYLERARELQARKKAASDAARSALRSSEVTREEIERLIFGLRDLPELYNKGSQAERLKIARSLVDSVTVYSAEKISVKWAEPWATFAAAAPELLKVRESERMRGWRDAIRTTIHRLAA